MDALHQFAGSFLLAMIRYLPATAMTSLTPLRWAPPMVRIVLAMVLAWLTVQVQPLQATLPQSGALGWVAAAVGELMVGLAFGLAVMLPQAALHMGGWLIDIQAGASAAVLFNPAAQGETQSLLGTLLMLVGTVLFFTLDLHLDLYCMLVSSAQILPLGQGGRLHPDGLFGMLGSSFLLGLVMVAPVVLALLAVDIGAAYATRSMPQANVYFLVLPVKMIVALLMLMATLPFVPALFERMYRDAFQRIPSLLGGA